MTYLFRDFKKDDLPVQRSLGLSWDTIDDVFTFKISSDQKPFTRRGVLSTINSLFDPLGFASPVNVQGKMLFRQMLTTSDPLMSPFDSNSQLGSTLSIILRMSGFQECVASILFVNRNTKKCKF